MVFNSIPYIGFLVVVFVLYWKVCSGSLRIQNACALGASYLFYGMWNWKCLGLVVISTVIDYFAALRIQGSESERTRKAYLALSLFVNLGILATFKYFDFFVDAFADLVTWVGLDVARPSLRLILPIGISFYTFQTLGYTIDVYRRRVPAEGSLSNFAAYVTFFPQLVAGPIERSDTLLPQFRKLRVFNDPLARNGCRQMLCGYLKKIVIADNCAIAADAAFQNYDALPASALLVGAFCATIQIYADLSGYSDIAIGTAKLFGFRLMRNFDFPYFSRDMAEAWRRWHISLSTWFRDYVFLPMGGMRGGKWVRTRNLLLTFALIGIWHGANWTFICFGLIHGILVAIAVQRVGRRRWTSIPAEGRWFPSPTESVSIATTFILICFSMVVFRAESIRHAWEYLSALVSPSLLQAPGNAIALVPGVAMLMIEWCFRYREHVLDIADQSMIVRWGAYVGCLLLIVVFGEFGGHEFIYFQF